MEKEMKLSIIVPVYNMASDHKLEYCLDSLVNQTVEDYEIIAVDDCSTDNSMEILKEYERRFPEKFRAVHSEVNRHQGGAKNIGLRMAKGEWIGFIDSDDWIRPDMYERLIEPPCIIIISMILPRYIRFRPNAARTEWKRDA